MQLVHYVAQLSPHDCESSLLSAQLLTKDAGYTTTDTMPCNHPMFSQTTFINVSIHDHGPYGFLAMQPIPAVLLSDQPADTTTYRPISNVLICDAHQ